MSKQEKDQSALGYVLESLVPFTDANTKIVFRPSAFFAELDRKGKIASGTLRSTYYRAKAQGLIKVEGSAVALSARAYDKLHLHPAVQLAKGQCILVTFDIPEEYAGKRRQLRSLLKELKFVQEQRSVWACTYDHKGLVQDLVNELSIDMYVRIYIAQEARNIK